MVSPRLLSAFLLVLVTSSDPAKLQQQLRGTNGRDHVKPWCAAGQAADESTKAWSANEGSWVTNENFSPGLTANYDPRMCTYMQPKFECGLERSARITRWSWEPKAAAAGGATCANTDFARGPAAEADAEFVRCTAGKKLALIGDSNTRNMFVGLLCRFHDFRPPFSVRLDSNRATRCHNLEYGALMLIAAIRGCGDAAEGSRRGVAGA